MPRQRRSDIRIVAPRAAHELNAARTLLREYAASLGIDLSFQHFEQELADLAQTYAPPHAALLLAWVGDALAGCCALRPLANADYPNACEMKRLYVRPVYRGMGLGRRLAEATLDAARVAGYEHVLLDTLDDMEAARSLYEDLGFTEIPPYYHSPIAGAHYLMARLSDSRL